MRDFIKEMQDKIAEKTVGTYNAREVAMKLTAELDAEDSELLYGWLATMAETLIWQAINDRDRSMRMHARTQSSRRVFGDVVRAMEEGDLEPAKNWLNMPFSIKPGVRKFLGDMTADDLRVVADSYRARARANELNADFLDAIRNRVGDGQVRDYYSPEQLTAMWASLGN